MDFIDYVIISEDILMKSTISEHEDSFEFETSFEDTTETNNVKEQFSVEGYSLFVYVDC